MNSASVLTPTASRAIPARDLCYVARRYRDELKANSEFHEFILHVRDISGPAVANEIWQVFEMIYERNRDIRLSKTPELRSIINPPPWQDELYYRTYWLAVLDKRIIRPGERK